MSTLSSAHLTLPVSERDHAQGPANAPVTLVEYGDYQCPSCGEAYALVKRLQQRLGERLRLVFRNFPLAQMHPHAEHAAEAAEIAGKQGKFWEMHDIMFANQKDVDSPAFSQDSIMAWARKTYVTASAASYPPIDGFCDHRASRT